MEIKGKPRGESQKENGPGRAAYITPGVLSRCQEADRFLLSGHESAAPSSHARVIA